MEERTQRREQFLGIFKYILAIKFRMVVDLARVTGNSQLQTLY